MPLVSVVIPNYNHARFLPKRIESVLAQTFQNFELILLDDASTDSSQEVLRRYGSDPRAKLCFNRANSGGPFKQWNRGVGMSQGEYIWIAESDDWADKCLLERLVGVLDRNPSVNLAYCRSWEVDEDDRVIGLVDRHHGPPETNRWSRDFQEHGPRECREALFFANTIPNASAVLFRRQAYLDAGGAEENLRICGDWRVWVTMLLKGDLAYVSEPLNYYRTHCASVRSQTHRNAVALMEHFVQTEFMLQNVEVPPESAERRFDLLVDRWIRLVRNQDLSEAISQAHQIALVGLNVDQGLPRRFVRAAHALIRSGQAGLSGLSAVVAVASILCYRALRRSVQMD